MHTVNKKITPSAPLRVFGNILLVSFNPLKGRGVEGSIVESEVKQEEEGGRSSKPIPAGRNIKMLTS